MPEQIIKQPDGKLAVFSTVVDAWTILDATADEIVTCYRQRAADEAERQVRRILDAVLDDRPQDAYAQAASVGHAAERLEEIAAFLRYLAGPPSTERSAP